MINRSQRHKQLLIERSGSRQVIGDAAHGQWNGSASVDLGSQRVGIAVEYLSRSQGVAWFDQLRAGGDDADMRLPGNRHFGKAQRGEQGDLGRLQAHPFCQDALPSLQVFALDADVAIPVFAADAH